MATWFWTLIAVICGLVYYHFKKKLNYFKELNIPYEPGWPIVGSFLDNLIRKKHFCHLMRDKYNKHSEAKYFGVFQFGNEPIIVLRDVGLIKSVTIKNSDKFPDHLPLVDPKIDPLFGGNLFNLTGDMWKEFRNLLTPAFTSSKLKMMFHLIVECANNFIKHIESLPDEAKRGIDTKDLFTKTTNDIIATCAFGISVDSLKDPKNDFYVLGRKATNFQGIQGLKFIILRSFPRLVKLFNLRFIPEEIARFFTNVIDNTIRTRDEKNISRPDILQQMMDSRDKETKHFKLDLKMITAQAFGSFFAGFETTATQMCLMAHELAIHPDIQKRLQDEIDEVMRESSNNPSYETINGMLYLDAVFNETLRKHSQAPFLDRVCVADFELPPALPGRQPFTLKPGMNIWIPTTAIHMDSKYYDEPDNFNPDRYYQKKVTINDVFNLSFGIGPRGCIGNRFATIENKILFVYLLSKFSFAKNEKTCSPLEYDKKTLGLVPKGGFILDIKPRN